VDPVTAPARSDALALLCRARDRLCALPLEHLVETMRPLPVTPVPGAAPFVRGLSLIRGGPVPVVDLGALLGAREQAEPTRFVTLRIGDRRVALAVERVVGIQQLPSVLTTLPPVLADAPAEFVSAIGAVDAELLLVLQALRLVPDSVWGAAEAGSAG
jgi:purine-binding chemotaxis protein CheW